MLQRKSTKILLSLNLTALVLFLTIWFGVITNSPWIKGIDTQIALAMANLSNLSLDKFMLVFAELTRPVALVGVASIIAVILIVKKKYCESMFLVVATAGGALIKVLLKAFIERPRPPNDYLELTDFSFPSGHATLSLIFFVALIYLFLNRINNRGWRLFFAILVLFFILFIDFNRLYLNAHFVSDVFGGIFLGTFWLTFTILMFKALKERHQKKS